MRRRPFDTSLAIGKPRRRRVRIPNGANGIMKVRLDRSLPLAVL